MGNPDTQVKDELTEAELDKLEVAAHHNHPCFVPVHQDMICRLIAAARKGIKPIVLPENVHDDPPSYTPGVYTMGTREAIEAGFVSYDKLTEADAMTDVEKLIERLEKKGGWLSMSEPFPDRLCEVAAAMLRSLAAERDDWKALENFHRTKLQDEIASLRAKLEEPCDVCEAHADQARQLRAKLERAREALNGTLKALDVGYAVAEGESFDISMGIIDAASKQARATLEELK